MTKTCLWQKIVLVLFGFLLTVFLLEIGLRLAGLVLLQIQEQKNERVLKQKGTYRIMCLGESTTADFYPAYLEEILNQCNIGKRFAVINKGVIGTNTSIILEQLKDDLDTYHPDMVITMMGINDKGKHIPYASMVGASNPLFSSFRVYKLFCLLWAHVSNKIQEVSWRNNVSRSGPFAATNPSKTLSIEPQDRIGIEHANEEEKLKQAIRENPSNSFVYGKLAFYYRVHNRRIEAIVFYKKALELNPNNGWYYASLGNIYSSNDGTRNLAEKMLKKAIKLDPQYTGAYLDLGLQIYMKQGKLLEAERVFLNLLQVDPHFSNAYLELADCYQKQKKFFQARELLKRAIERDSGNADRYYGALSNIPVDSGKNVLKKEHYRKAGYLQLESYNPETFNNYIKLKKILDERKIKYVCAQYPVRSIKPLLRIFQGQTGIIFVDNEAVFKEAIVRSNYDEFFVDKFGGDFGHCSLKGNWLLAENIAQVILKEVFDK